MKERRRETVSSDSASWSANVSLNHYEHSQTGGLLLIVGGIVGLFFLARVSPFAFGTLFIALLGFGALTVSVDHSRIEVRFGISHFGGWFRKRISLDTVKDCRTVRNNWLHGFGIRYIGNGWLYNVAGLDAVALHLTNGRRLRIGTDQPNALAAAIAQAREWNPEAQRDAH